MIANGPEGQAESLRWKRAPEAPFRKFCSSAHRNCLKLLEKGSKFSRLRRGLLAPPVRTGGRLRREPPAIGNSHYLLHATIAARGRQLAKLAFFRISDNLGPKAHLPRSDNYANKPRRRREKFGAFFKHFEQFQWANQPKFSKGRFQRRPSAPA